MTERRYRMTELTHAMGDVLARMKTEGHTSLREFVDATTEALKALPVAEDPIVAKARALLDSVSFDNNGALVGNQFVGGEGGLISPKTIRAADELRKALS